jgi:hypothetical protein
LEIQTLDFFHAKAKIKCRKNHITFLQDEQGKEHINHDVKANKFYGELLKTN